MKKFAEKKFIAIILVLFMTAASLPAMTSTAKAEDTNTAAGNEMTSNEAAQAWGFNTSQTEDSKKREVLGVNPWKGHKNTVSTFGEVPLEIAVTGSRVSNDNDNHDQVDDDLNDIYYYDNIKRDTGDQSHLTMGKTGKYEDVSGVSYPGESDVRPSTTVAADMNGDGIDEIVHYYINISYSGTDTDKHDGDISNFNNGVAGYEATFYVEAINSQTGEIINDKDSGKLLTVNKKESPNFFIPDSIYYWSSYMQMTAGDFNNDGKKEVALVVPDKSGASNNNLYILGLSGNQIINTYSKDYTCNSSYGNNDADKKFSAFHLTSGDCDNDGVDELVFTNQNDVLTTDDPSYIHVIDYKNSSYTEIIGSAVQIGTDNDPMGNAGVTVGDIDNDGLNEIVVGGYMVNKAHPNATYKYTSKDGSTTKDIQYYHELAMAYMKYDNETNVYSNFQGFTVFRDEERTAGIPDDKNETSYGVFDKKTLDSSRRYRNADNWTMPIQAVSLTGYVNNMTNDQIFFGNYMYYYKAAAKGFAVYDTDGSVTAKTDPVVYSEVGSSTASITAIIPGSFLSDDTSYLTSPGRKQLLIAYVKKSKGGARHFEFALMYENAGNSMKPERSVKYVADADDTDFNDMKFYPTVCAPNMDNDAKFVQYTGHAFTYTKPEALNVIASVPYFKDMTDAYPVGVWGDPGSTYFRKSSGGSQTNKGFTDVSLGWYYSFEQDLGVFGLKLVSIEMETEASVNTSYEYSKTIEKESTIEYETSEGQDSVVMVSSPLDVYQYRYYQDGPEYKAAYPKAVKDDPSTWGTMEVSLPGAPETLVFPVNRFNQLAEKYNLQKVNGDFWIHTLGDPGTYPTSTDQFKNASNIKSSKDSINATTGGSSMSSELSITETEEDAYSFSLTLASRIGAGAGGLVTGVTTENTRGYGGAKASFKNTTIGATLNGFPDPDKYGVDLDTKAYGLSIKLHSYTTKFNGHDILVLYYTVADYHGLPKLPENFRTTGATESTIDLAWEVPEVISTKLRPNNYLLERFDPYYKKWLTAADNISIKPGNNTYTDTDVYAGENYKYRLIAEDSTGTITNAVTLTASTQQVGGDPPVITSQPRDTALIAGSNVTFSVSAKLPEGVSPTRIYYQWYQRNSSSGSWSTVNGAIEKTLTLTGITQEMNGYQYYCEVTRLGNNGIHCTAKSDYALLTVLDHTPRQFNVNYTADANGSIKAQQICRNVSYDITSGSTLPETSEVKFTAEPAPGYHVGKWTVNGKAVAGNNSNTLVIDNLSDSVNVNVAFNISTFKVGYRVIENTNEGQGKEDWGTVSAVCDGKPLPLGENTTLLGEKSITFTASPKSGYMVDYWSVNNQGVGGYNGNIYTIDSLSQDSDVVVCFAKAVNYSVNVSSKISNTGTAYCDNSSFVIHDDGIVVQPGSAIEKGSKVDITVTPPASAAVESWTISRVDEQGHTGTPVVLGSQTSYTFDQLDYNYNVVVNYRIISTKKVEFGTQNGNGTISAQVVGNTTSTGTVHSGDQVQMYDDVAFTAVPENSESGVSGWIVNGVYESNNSLTRVVKADKNTTVKVVFETLPQPKDPVYEVNMNAHDMAAIDGSSIASDADGDILTVTAITKDGIPDKNVATASLGTEQNAGKLIIKGVNEGSTTVKVEVSDDNGHSIIVTIPIKVVINKNPAPPLTGVINTSVGKNDGKIIGLENGRIYEYKALGETDYHEVSGVTEITGLTPGSYKVYCPASPGYTESPEVTVVVPLNEFAGGNGEAATPFRITTPEMLDKVRNHSDKCFILMNDLDMTSYLSETGAGYNNGFGFNTIYSSAADGSFYGTFDGNGKVIRGLFMRENNSGLFGRMHGTVKNLGVDVDIIASSYTVGGLASENYGTIERCYTTGTVKEDKEAYDIGGLVGLNSGTIENCYSTTNVTGNGHIGGLVGETRGPVKYSYAVGKVSVGTFITGTTMRGLVGYYGGNNIVNSYYEQTIGTLFQDGMARSTEDMKKQTTFVDWDFDNIWMINEGVDYPRLRQVQSSPVLVTGIDLNKTELELTVGGTETLTAAISPDDATDKSIKWTSSDTNIVTVDESGKVTAAAIGIADITAAAQDGSGKTASCKVTVSAALPSPVSPVLVTGIDLNKTELELTVGGTETLTAAISPDDATDKSIKWTSSDTNIVTVDESGKVTAAAIGIADITAAAEDGSGKTASCKVTVSAAPPAPVSPVLVTGIDLNKTELELTVGGAETLTAAVSPDDATDKSIKWTSSDTNIVAVDESGKVTAAAIGIADITAAAEDGSGKTASCKVTVSAGSSGGNNPGGGSSGGGITSAPTPTSNTVSGVVIDNGTGQQVKSIQAKVTDEANGTKTVEVKSGDAVMMKQPDGTQSQLSDITKLGFKAENANTNVTLSSDGTIQVKNLLAGTESKIDVTYDLGDGQKITIGKMDIKVDSNGKVSLTYNLIDPYGIITDSSTGKPVEGAEVTLYYANTERNKKSKKTIDTVVQLPVIDGFKPNSNKNPQISDASGAYGFMVYSDTDYYIVSKKDGYEDYKSPTISVEKEIVKWNFKMNKIITGVNRISGSSRIDTAIEIAEAEYTGKVKNVVLATAENYPDALSGSVLAYKLNAPVLLVGSTDADVQKVIDYMKSNMEGTGTAYILGGTGAIGSTVENKITSAGFNSIIRLGGADKYETAVKIADSLNVQEGTTIVLVNGDNYPDALSISSEAAEMGMPILLVRKNGISDSAKNEISKIKPSKIYVIGLEGVISDSVLNEAASIANSTTVRIGGADRYKTSIEVAKYFNLSGHSVCAATGDDFPDALAGSVYAANHNAPVILTGSSLSDEIINYLEDRTMSGAAIFGGEGAVSKAIEEQIFKLIEK